MGNQLNVMRQSIVEFLQKLDKKAKLLLAGAVALVLVISIGGAVMLNRVKYTALYSGLSASEAGTIMTTLQEMGVTAKTSGTDTILVPEKQADELRMELAAKGFPNTGLNYDLFSNSASFGSTDLERQTYLQYQLQENLRTTISRMSKVKDCIVLVNLATTSSFVIDKNTSEASAAVLLDLEDGAELTPEEAKTIGELVIKSVPKLTLENVTVTDSDMKTYDLTESGGEKDTTYSNTQQEMTEQMKQVLSDQVLRVLKPAIGDGNVAVSVNLSLDFDKGAVETIQFSPPVEGETEGMRRSSEKIYEAVRDGKASGGATGTDSNGVSTTEYVYNGLDNDQYSEKYSEIYNYELNQMKTQIERAQGAVKDLSVSVLINSEVEGITGYKEAVKSLVANAIGVNAKYISVETMPFVQNAGQMTFEDYFKQNASNLEMLNRTDLIKTIAILAALLLVVFMILNFFKKKNEPILVAEDENGEIVDVTIGGDAGQEMGKEEEEQLLQDLVMKKSDQAAKVEELMDRYPEAVVQIIRSWLNEDF